MSKREGKKNPLASLWEKVKAMKNPTVKTAAVVGLIAVGVGSAVAAFFLRKRKAKKEEKP